MLSTYHGHFALSKLLLEHGADANVLNDRGQSPLAGAVFKHEGAIVELLCQWGADPDLGTPSAQEAVGVFRMEGEWGEVFEEVRGRLREGREREWGKGVGVRVGEIENGEGEEGRDGVGEVKGPGGVKAGLEMM